MSLTELALLDGRRPLPLGDVIRLTLNFILYSIVIFIGKFTDKKIPSVPSAGLKVVLLTFY
jgi:hypothetical protein